MFEATFILCITIISANAAAFPPFVKLCTLSAPDVEQCFLENANSIKPHMKDGIPELQLPSLDPLSTPDVSLGIPNFVVNLTESQLKHASEFTINHVKFARNKNDITMTMNVYFPLVELIANYHMAGKVLFMQLAGEGPLNAKFLEVTADIYISGKLTKGYFVPQDSRVIFKPKDIKVRFDEIFKDNTELTETTNIIFNENIMELFREFEDVLESELDKVVFSLLREFFKTFSLNELFPNDKFD